MSCIVQIVSKADFKVGVDIDGRLHQVRNRHTFHVDKYFIMVTKGVFDRQRGSETHPSCNLAKENFYGLFICIFEKSI